MFGNNQSNVAFYRGLVQMLNSEPDRMACTATAVFTFLYINKQ